MSRRLRILLALALLLPLAVLGQRIADEEALRRGAQSLIVPITGFDPRSLVYGQYIQFQFAWTGSARPPECTEPGPCCLCLTGAADAPAAAAQSCAATTAGCIAVLRPAPEPTGRFWLNERDASRLQAMLTLEDADFAVRLSVSGDGRWRLRDLLVDGQPYRLDQR